MLQSMGLQRVGHDWATEQRQQQKVITLQVIVSLQPLHLMGSLPACTEEVVLSPAGKAPEWAHSLKDHPPGPVLVHGKQTLLLCVFFNWSIVDLHHCFSFKWTAKWFTYTYIHIYFSFFSLIGYYYKMLSIVSWVIQHVLVGYLVYI